MDGQTLLKNLRRAITRGLTAFEQCDQPRIDAMRADPMIAADVAALLVRIKLMGAAAIRELPDDILTGLRDAAVMRCVELIGKAFAEDVEP